MRIKRVEIIGFKSFCDRAVIQIDSPITSVVGPNGCGKSNIVDAIRWCMGEQSAKHLRGKAMEDVIFAGSESRGPAPMAEVSLTFDDVGFSRETLEQAQKSDEAEAERALAAIGSDEGDALAAEATGAEALAADPAGAEALAAGSAGAEALAPDPADAAEVMEVPAAEGAEPASAAEVGLGLEGEEPASAAEGAAGAERVGAPAEAVADGGEAPPETVGVWLDAEGNPIASPTEEVAALLADKPPMLNFAEYTEVTLTRRLYRDGTSLYFINKTPCRLRDITDFFLGTGVGTKAYAIIEQGRIGQIVSSRPVDRRIIIEEAAGITKFKTKKKAAERKLEQTRQNLLRVSDIVAELEKRMGTLRRQAQKAERYRKYKAELRDIELWRASHRFLELRAEHQRSAGDAARIGEELGAARAQWSAQDAHVVAERGELALEERRLSAAQDGLYELDSRIRLTESKLAFERREAEELVTKVANATEEIAERTALRDAAAAELAVEEASLASLSDEVAREGAVVSAREAEHGACRGEVARLQAELDAARNELGRRRAEVATAEAELAAMVRRREESTARHARVAAEREQQHERLLAAEREAKRVDGVLADLRQTRLDLGSQTESFEARRALLAEDVARGEAEVETLRTELHRRSSRLVSLREIQERYEGFARGTRAVMQRASNDDKILGLVADAIRAPESLEVAVEAALGDRLGGVLVSDAGAGRDAIAYLKETGGGRSAFVPLVGAAQRPGGSGGGDAARAGEAAVPWAMGALDAGLGAGGIVVEDHTGLTAAAAAIGGQGVLGRMSDLVSFDDQYPGVGARLVGGCVVVDSLDRALALAERGVTDTLVTLDGDVVDGGVVAGGSKEAQGAGVLAQKREIRDLEEIAASLQRDLTEATARLVTARGDLKAVTLALEGLRGQVHQGDLEIMGHEKDSSRLHHELERVRERLTQLGAEQLELETRLTGLAEEDLGIAARREQAVTVVAELERAQLELTSALTAQRDQLESLAAALTEARVRAAQLGEKRASLMAATLRLASQRTEHEARMERLAADVVEAQARIAALHLDTERLASELEALRQDRLTAAQQLAEGRESYDQRVRALAEVEQSARALRSQADQLTGELAAVELRRNQVEMNQRVLEEGILERYQVELEKVLIDYHQRPMIGEAEDARQGELRELIERMGTDINLTAIEEYAEVSSRFEFLSAQRADLDRAVDQLQKAIDKINKTSRRLFKETFASVNATFKEVFPRLFRGGQAALSLTGGEDVDLLEAGIEIMAQPPGKKNSTVEQLSGGEKALTAVALVFSIFLIKPSPFCILDEVDAPLDEANVDRYNELVREMTDRSQFIVITHNKRTMESADNLYGVTMQEPGVSKLVTVNLSRLGKGQAA
ncbi:MAG: chromosome segregation protein SMC [Kofleriaceae bacterium]